MKTFRINKFILITILVILFSIIFWVAFKSSKNQSGSAFLEEDFRQQRLEMVSKTIENRGVTDSNVLKAMRNVPRHQFVPEEYKEHSYKDHPLPIGYGQTISQPYIVAWMTELLELKPGEKVLEIGTGSGYQAAVQTRRWILWVERICAL